MDKVEYSPIIEDPNAEPRKKNWKVIIGVVVMVVVVIVLIVVLTDNGDWSEWVAEKTVTCGSGDMRYTRTCTLKSISQAFGRKCNDALGLGEEKVEKYDLGKCPRVGRYVWLERVERAVNSSDANNALNIAEIEVIAPDGTNLAKNAVVTAGSNFDAVKIPNSNLVDGNLLNFAHTMDGGADLKKHWFRIDLGADKSIKEIYVRNRRDCCQFRLNGTRIRIQNSGGADVYTGPVVRDANTPTALNYKYDVTY